MPAILSKIRDEVALRARGVPPGAGVALGLGFGAALAACALYGSRDRRPSVAPNNNNNEYKRLQVAKNGGVHADRANGNGATAACAGGAGGAGRCGSGACALCRGDADCDNRQNIGAETDDVVSAEPEQRVPGLNLEFLRQLVTLVRVMVPRFKCRETALLGAHTVCLFTRTLLSIYVASLEGSIVKHIVKKDMRNFALMLLQWFGIAVPATFINSMIRYLESKLALAFRSRLVEHAYELYFKNQAYYRVSNLDGRIENPDHRLTDDVSMFTASVAHLYGSLTKPCFDLLLIVLTLASYSSKMKGNIFLGPGIATVVIALTGQLLRILSPKFGALASEEAKRKANLRHIHSRLIAHAEEVAFYGGHKVELNQLQSAYSSLVQQMASVLRVKLWYVMLEQFFMKYVWSGTGMIMLALPILTGERSDGGTDGISTRTEYLTTSRHLLNSAADAIERLLSSYKEVVTLAGYSERVADMLRVFGEVADGRCVRAAHVDSALADNARGFTVTFRDGQPVPEGVVVYTSELSIHLRDVPIVTPACDVVASGLTLDIVPGRHLLITGPNGCGKSSLFRIISGLWPVYGGELRLPAPCECEHCTDGHAGGAAGAAGAARARGGRRTRPRLTSVVGRCERRPIMFYIPQRPYMSMGTLLDQVTYPCRAARADAAAEARAAAILRAVRLDTAAARHGGLRATRDWAATLSGGEKQRMAMARMFYHRPVYALLDECTSAVSMETEVVMYEEAVRQGITLLSITHRPSVWRYHTHVLQFDGQGNWSFKPLALEQSESSHTPSTLPTVALPVVPTVAPTVVPAGAPTVDPTVASTVCPAIGATADPTVAPTVTNGAVVKEKEAPLTSNQ